MSGKLRAQRAKAMKVKDAFTGSSGNPTTLAYIDGRKGAMHVMLRQGVLIKVGLDFVV